MRALSSPETAAFADYLQGAPGRGNPSRKASPISSPWKRLTAGTSFEAIAGISVTKLETR